MGEMIRFERPDGNPCYGYLASAGSGKPSVVLLPERWGINQQICGVARRYADAGYTALVPDLYHGRTTDDPDEAIRLMQGLDFNDTVHQDIRGAALYLQALGGKVGVTGYGLGGAFTVAIAVLVPEVAAASCYYGIPSPELADPAKIHPPFQGHFADRDDWCPPYVVDQLEQTMRAAGLTPEIHRYPAAHAFCNETSPETYDPVCAQLAFERTLAFFSRTLA